MLYSKCDIDFNAVGKTTAVDEPTPVWSMESTVMDLRLETAIDNFFIEHARWEYEGMALEAYKEACGDQTVLESNLVVIREADENAGKEKFGQGIKKMITSIPNMISSAIDKIMTGLSNSFLGRIAEKLKTAKKEKIDTIDFKAKLDKLQNALKVFDVISQKIKAMRGGKQTTTEEIKEDIAKQTGGSADGGMKATLNLESKDDKTTTSTPEEILKAAKDIPGKIVPALKSAKSTIGKCLKDLYDMIMSHDTKGFRNIGWQVAQLIMVAGGVVVMAVMSVVNAIRTAAGSVGGAAKDAFDKAKAWKNTKEEKGGAKPNDIDTTATA